MQLSKALEEGSVLGHGVIGPGKYHDAAVKRVEYGQHHGDGNDYAAGISKEHIGCLGSEIVVAGIYHAHDGRIGKYPVYCEVEKYVKGGNSYY